MKIKVALIEAQYDSYVSMYRVVLPKHVIASYLCHKSLCKSICFREIEIPTVPSSLSSALGQGAYSHIDILFNGPNFLTGAPIVPVLKTLSSHNIYRFLHPDSNFVSGSVERAKSIGEIALSLSSNYKYYKEFL